VKARARYDPDLDLVSLDITVNLEAAGVSVRSLRGLQVRRGTVDQTSVEILARSDYEGDPPMI